MKRTFLFLTTACLLFSSGMHSQVTIGSGQKPLAGALLDLKEEADGSSKKGVMLPRVALEDVAKMGPCVQSDLAQLADKQAHVGLIVYNTTDAIEVGLCTGVYAWAGEQWMRISKPCKSTITPEMLYSPNCYIVGTGQDSEEIPVAKAYLVSESRSDMTNLNRADKVYIDILWQDTPDLIDKVELVDGDKGIYSKFMVTAKGVAQGNALVALRVGANGNDMDPIVWSWHIWVTDYNPNDAGMNYLYNNTEKEYVFMDRNIGALSITPADTKSIGMMYQWGRKDPFTAAEGNTSADFSSLYSHPDNTVLGEVNEEILGGGNTQPSGTGIKHTIPPSGSSNLELSIQNPLAFYYGSYIKNDINYIFDWYSGDGAGTISDNDLWGTASQKSPFDPCPAGWRVPAYNGTKSPWFPYIGGSQWETPPGEATPGIKVENGKGCNLIGNAGGGTITAKAPLGYYPACYARAPKARFYADYVGASGTYPNLAGGTFLSAYAGSPELHYWTSSVPGSDNTKAKAMHMTGSISMGGVATNENPKSKATGAFVRCVKE